MKIMTRKKINLTNTFGLIIIITSIFVVLWQYGLLDKSHDKSDNTQELKIDIDLGPVLEEKQQHESDTDTGPRCC